MRTELRKAVLRLSWQPELKWVSWDAMSCNLNLLYNPTASNSGTLKMETAGSSETLVPICQNIHVMLTMSQDHMRFAANPNTQHLNQAHCNFTNDLLFALHNTNLLCTLMIEPKNQASR